MVQMSEEKRHVARSHAEHVKEAWCGERLSMQWFFVDVDHAAEYGLSGGRIYICPACCDAIQAALEKLR